MLFISNCLIISNSKLIKRYPLEKTEHTYTLGAYRAVYVDSPAPMESVTFQADVQNPDTLTQEERVWQQESDRSKPHQEPNDTLVNPTSNDFPKEEAVRRNRNRAE